MRDGKSRVELHGVRMLHAHGTFHGFAKRQTEFRTFSAYTSKFTCVSTLRRSRDLPAGSAWRQDSISNEHPRHFFGILILA
jgi:hypothetical protein